MKIKLTQGTVKYFIITAISAFTGGNTTITVYGGTDYDLANATITSPYYSMVRSPFGFPMSPAKWSVTLVNNTNPETGLAQNTWANLGSVSISLPIGSWLVFFMVNGLYGYKNGTGVGVRATLSTANNSESDPELTIATGADGATATVLAVESTGTRIKTLDITSKTTYYINFLQNRTGTTNVGCTQRVVRAVCAYL